MSRAPRTLPRLALGVAAAATAVAAATVPAVASAGTDSDGPNIVVENAGDQTDAIMLPAPAQVGQTTQTTITIDMDLAVDDSGTSTEVAVGLAMDFMMEVTEVAADDGYVILLTLEAVEVTDMPEGADASAVPCVGIEGLQLEQTLDAAGNTVSVEPVGSGLGGAEMSCVQQFTSTQSQSAVIFPAEPIGPGAAWTAELVVANQGIEFPVSYRYVLTDVTDGRYSIEATIESEFDVTQSGVNVTGTMSGSGTTSGAVTNPLDISSTFKATTDLVSSLGDTDMAMSMDMTVDMSTAAPAS